MKKPATPPPAAANGAGGATGTGNPYVIDVSEATFGQEVVERSMQVLVVVDLWAEWCEPCKALSPLLERVIAEYNGAVVLAKVDVDVNPRISQAFGVQSIPTVVAVAAGQPVDAFTGAQPESQVRAWVKGLIEALKDRLPGIANAPAPAAPDGSEAEAAPDPLVVAAEEALDAGDFPAAIAAYERLLAGDPGNPELVLTLAQLQFQQHALELPEDAVEQARARPDDVAAQRDAADLLFATGRVEPAFETLLAVISTVYGDDRIGPRDHLLQLFTLLGQDDPLVAKYRRKLATALF